MTLEQENAELRLLLRDAWKLYCDTYLTGEVPEDIKRNRAFCALDKALRGRGIVGGKE